MKRFVMMVMALAVMGLISAGYAQEKKKEGKRGDMIRGTVTKVSEDGKKLTVKTMAGKGQEGEEKEYEPVAGASIQIDGADGKAADLKDKMVGLQVQEGKVTRVISRSGGKRKKSE